MAPSLHPVRSRLSPRARLALLAGVLLGLFALFWIFDVVSEEQVRAWVEPFGAAAPLAYVVLAAGLGVALVPGPVLAGGSGLLFGTVVGTAVTIAAAILGSVVALLIGRRAGRESVRELSGPRWAGVEAALQRHGLVAVIVQRLAPVVPDAPCSYLAGAIGLRVHQIALGTLVGVAPRAFSYNALGDALGEPGSPLAVVGLGVLALTVVVGTLLAARMLRRGPGERTP